MTSVFTVADSLNCGWAVVITSGRVTIQNLGLKMKIQTGMNREPYQFYTAMNLLCIFNLHFYLSMELLLFIYLLA